MIAHATVATLHGSTALPPVQKLIFFFFFFFFSFFSVFQGNDDGADGLLGLIMALSLIARAATVLLRNKKARAHLIRQHGLNEE
jgi:UDP-N-acetylmuramyl pentapeptide phosphotransferase/UDP-N-acetylglucosamine-1-phosphate transferase